MKYARIVDGKVLELLQPPEGYQLSDCYHEGIVRMCVPIPVDLDVQIGWTHSEDTGFAPPVEPPVDP